VPDRLIRDAGALATHQDGLAAMARTTGEIAASIQAKVATVLGAIQIGDIARQRLEHVLAGCEMLDAHLEGRAPTTAAEEAACHHLLALLHAQLEETAVDFRRETLVLVDSCATLSLRPTACWRCRRPRPGLPKIWRPPVNLVPARTGKRDCRGHRHDRPVAGSRRTGRSNPGPDHRHGGRSHHARGRDPPLARGRSSWRSTSVSRAAGWKRSASR
jgi:hypothetical protein